jgi:hypothetical protein
LSWKDGIPLGHSLPVNELHDNLKNMRKAEAGELTFEFTKKSILDNLPAVIKALEEDKKLSLRIKDVVGKFSFSEVFRARDLVELMSKDLVMDVLGYQYKTNKVKMIEAFKNADIDLSLYPKIKNALSHNFD